VLFTGGATIKDRKLVEQIGRGEVLHLSADGLLAQNA
jgi:hypothetical protein